MRRLTGLVVLLALVPATAASAAELEELLERSREASYSAEQVISCNTPAGIRNAVVPIAQHGGSIWIGSQAEMQIGAGAGGWTLIRSGDPVKSASVASGKQKVEPLYTVDDERADLFLGRPAVSYRLIRDGMSRAVLVFDNATGALVESTTLLDDGTTYCQRRFISFDPLAPQLPSVPAADSTLSGVTDGVSTLPGRIGGFQLLDHYVEQEGSTFTYYSDGFFSFAVFETATRVALPGGSTVEMGGSAYDRSFTAGQTTYIWETKQGGMALVGDLPTDMHEAVLSALPESDAPGIFRRLWRSLFG